VRTNEPDERELAAEERSLVEWIDAAFRPAASDGQGKRFVRRIERRIERRRRVQRVALPAVALAASALAALLWSLSSQTASVDGAEGTLLQAFADPPAGTDEMVEPDDYLPDDYRALASLMQDDEPQ
jgi:hypothetical protein